MRGKLIAAIGTAVLLASAAVGVAAADTTPCPTGSIAIGLLCTDRSGTPAPGTPGSPGVPILEQNGDQRLLLIRACLDLNAAGLAGAQTGGPVLTPRGEPVAIELVCLKPVPVVPVIPVVPVEPVPVAPVPVPVTSGPTQLVPIVTH
jgi:hypothetical protein